jgi:hypothetical protein
MPAGGVQALPSVGALVGQSLEAPPALEPPLVEPPLPVEPPLEPPLPAVPALDDPPVPLVPPLPAVSWLSPLQAEVNVKRTIVAIRE